MNQEKKERISMAIKLMLKDDSPFDAYETLPYSYADEPPIHYQIHYIINKVFLIKENDDECPIQGHVVLKITKILIEDYNEFEELKYSDDVMEVVWDDLRDSVSEKVNKIFPQVCLETKLYTDYEGFF